MSFDLGGSAVVHPAEIMDSRTANTNDTFAVVWFMFLMLLMIQPLTACSRSGGGQVEDKLRTPTDHELRRGFPGGALAVSTLGIKERQDRRRPDIATPRGRHATAALVTGERRMLMGAQSRGNPPTASSASRTQEQQPPPASAEGGVRLKKAGEVLRTPDIHVENVTLDLAS